ncbi:hypothetical protein HK102_010361, partial [Quaeritorhiza haematococci]
MQHHHTPDQFHTFMSRGGIITSIEPAHLTGSHQGSHANTTAHPAPRPPAAQPPVRPTPSTNAGGASARSGKPTEGDLFDVGSTAIPQPKEFKLA